MDIQTFLTGLLSFLNGTIVPFIIALAFLVFLWNVAQYFIIGSSLAGDEKKGTMSGRARARQYALYSIFAFVIIISIWGVVNLLVGEFGFGSQQPIVPDYMSSGGAGSSGGGSSANFPYAEDAPSSGSSANFPYPEDAPSTNFPFPEDAP